MRWLGLTRSKGAFYIICSTAVLGLLSTQVYAAKVNKATPEISGKPDSSVRVGYWYRFIPTASDRDTETRQLRFSIQNKPSWAEFSAYSGFVKGSPTKTGTWSNIRITVTDGIHTDTLPAFSITATGKATANAKPKISGSPGTSVTAGSAYRFKPSASDSDGNTLGFSIQNRPSWSSFNTSTGELSGTPKSANVGTYSGIVITASDGTTTASLPSFNLVVRAASSGGSSKTAAAPVITGSPDTSTEVGSDYSFMPTASDANGDDLTFSIKNRPSWASFNTSTGLLSGTPTASQTGAYSNVIITVSDGKATDAMPAFSIRVTAATATVGSNATLNWTAPTRNADGSTLKDLAGYRIYYGTKSNALTQTVSINNAGLTTYVLDDLTPATYYFAVRAFNKSGAESASSNLLSQTVR
jgi:hypothetical protein